MEHATNPWLAFQPNAPAMRLGQSTRNRKPDPCIAQPLNQRIVRPIQARKDPCLFFQWNATPLIAHGDQYGFHRCRTILQRFRRYERWLVMGADSHFAVSW